jgi:putative flippase GtrA
VEISLSHLLVHVKSVEGRKQLRYAGISAVFVPLGQIVIQILGRVVFMEREGLVESPNFTKASLAGAAILTLPNFFANKYLVWRDTTKDKLKTQVLVFWVAAMLGVALATSLTYVVERTVKTARASSLIESLAVFAAQLMGFGVVWVLRYLVLDKWLFKATYDGAEPLPMTSTSYSRTYASASLSRINDVAQALDIEISETAHLRQTAYVNLRGFVLGRSG